MTRVLLTGGSGFIAAHVLETLLQHGHSVVATVRTQEKASKIRNAYPSIPSKLLSFAIVENVVSENAFDQAVISDPPFEAVIHTASPFHYNVVDIQRELLDPAVMGTTGILRSIQKNAPTVKRVVITSSFASMFNAAKGNWPEHTYSETDWNPVSLEEAKENPANGYRASKTFAERAAWDFMEKEKPNFTLSTMCPPLVFGPVMNYLSSLDGLNTSNQRIRDLMLGKMKNEIAPTVNFVWVDVRDLALCHVLAIGTSAAANQRFFIPAGFYNNQKLAEILRNNLKGYESKLPGSDVDGGECPTGGMYNVDNSKVQNILGIKFRSLQDSIVDTAHSLQALGA